MSDPPQGETVMAGDQPPLKGTFLHAGEPQIHDNVLQAQKWDP